MYRPYGDDPNQELYAGDASSKPLTEKQKAEIQLKLRTQAAMSKPPAGLAQLANNALSDPSVQAIMYLLGLPETVVTSLATAVRNPGALPAGDLAKATWDRLQRGYTYADLYKGSGMNPQAADIAGLAASITSPVGEKSTAVRATQGAMKAGADALAAAGNAGVIGKNRVGETLMAAGYKLEDAANAEKSMAVSLGAGDRSISGDRPTYWDVKPRDRLGPWHSIGRESLYVQQPLSQEDFSKDFKVVADGIAWMKQSAKQGTPIYIYRSAPNAYATTGHGAQESDGTFFTIDPTVAASYALSNLSSSNKMNSVGVVEAVIDPKKVFIVQPRVIKFDDPSFFSNIRLAEQVEINLARSKEDLASWAQEISELKSHISDLNDKLKKARSKGEDTSAIEQMIVNANSRITIGRERILVLKDQEKAWSDELKRLNVPSKEDLASGKYSGSGKYSVLYTPDWQELASKAWSQGYDAIFNPASGEIVVSNVSRGKKGAPIDQVMSKATVQTDIFQLIGNYNPTPKNKLDEPFDMSQFYPLGPNNRSTDHWESDFSGYFEDPIKFPFLYGLDFDPSKIDPAAVSQYYKGLGYSPQQIANEVAKLKPQIEQQMKSGGIKYSDWFFITTGMPYSEYLKTQTKTK